MQRGGNSDRAVFGKCPPPPPKKKEASVGCSTSPPSILQIFPLPPAKFLYTALSDVKNDFAIDITAFVEAGTSTGYLARVKREHDGKVRYWTDLLLRIVS